MFTFKNILIFGVVLMFFAVILPLLIYINKGSQKETVEDEGYQKTLAGRIVSLLVTYFIVFLFMPSLLVLFCNYFKLVVYNAMPMNEFWDKWPGYSYEPVILFYQRIITPIVHVFRGIYDWVINL
jgi:glucan phosphoethanolaminetransferase (alkaline phosphatase superfamily)